MTSSSKERSKAAAALRSSTLATRVRIALMGGVQFRSQSGSSDTTALQADAASMMLLIDVCMLHMQSFEKL
jgi:hypothetical protein